LESHAGDVLDSGPAQPVLEEGLLVVHAEFGPAVSTPDGPGVDDSSLLAGQEAGVAVLRQFHMGTLNR